MSLQEKYSEIINRIQTTPISTLHATATLMHTLPDSIFEYMTEQQEVYRIAPKVAEDIESEYYIQRCITPQVDAINTVICFTVGGVLESITDIQDLGTDTEQVVAKEVY